MAYRKCFVPGCKNKFATNPEVKYFMFPINENLAKKWLDVVQHPSTASMTLTEIRNRYSVCALHFDMDQFQTNQRLKLNRGAIPSCHSSQSKQKDLNTPEESFMNFSPGQNIKRYDIKYERAKFGSLWMKDNSCTVTEIEVEPDLTAMELREDCDDEENAPCGSSEMTAGAFSRGETSQIMVIPKQEVVQDEDHLGSVKESASISEHFGDVTRKISVGDVVTTPVSCSSTTEDSPVQSVNKFQSVWLTDFHMDAVQVKEEPADYDSDVEDNVEQEPMAEVKTEVDMEEPPDVKEVDVQRDPTSQAAKPRRQKIFNCLHCGEVFSSLPEITEHVKTHPKMDSHICSKCNKSFSTLVQLDRLMSVQLKRMWSHMERQTYKCKECGRFFSSGLYLRKHEATHKEDRTAYKCTDCHESSI